MSERDANVVPPTDELREIERRRQMQLMPDWARAKSDQPVDPNLKNWFKELAEKLFGGRK